MKETNLQHNTHVQHGRLYSWHAAEWGHLARQDWQNSAWRCDHSLALSARCMQLLMVGVILSSSRPRQDNLMAQHAAQLVMSHLRMLAVPTSIHYLQLTPAILQKLFCDFWVPRNALMNRRPPLQGPDWARSQHCSYACERLAGVVTMLNSMT